MKKVKVYIEKGADDYSAYMDDTPLDYSCIGQGATVEQDYAYAFTLAGLQRITGVNQKQLGHYISGYRKPSNKTVRKIEDGIHRFSQQLSAVRFVDY